MKLPIVIDSNEASKGKAWKFKESCRVVSLVKHGCDYSLWGYTGVVGIERKSWPDYVRCLSVKGWPAFLKQVKKLNKNKYKCIIVEGHIDDYIHKRFSSMNSHVVRFKTAQLATKGIPVLFAGSRANANLIARIFLEETLKCLKTIL